MTLAYKVRSLIPPSNFETQKAVKKISCFLAVVLYLESSIKSDLINPTWVKVDISAMKINSLVHLHCFKDFPFSGPILKATVQQVLMNCAISKRLMQ